MKEKKNEFWVVSASPEYGSVYLMFNHKPQLVSWYRMKFGAITTYDAWYSRHGHCVLSERSEAKFDHLNNYSEPVKVRLVRTTDGNPDLYVQRYRDCLFINSSTERFWYAVKRAKGFLRFFSKWKWVESVRVPHFARISNKLFPEITENDGIVEMIIEKI